MSVLTTTQSTRAHPFTFSFRDPEFRHNPYPYLAYLQRFKPIFQGEYGVWLITRYEDVKRLNQDPRLGRDLRRWDNYEQVRPYLAESPLERMVERWIFSLDPPQHTALRSLFATIFTPRMIASLKPKIEGICRELLNQVERQQSFDFVKDFAQPFPIRVIATMLDLPTESYRRLKGWSDDLLAIVEPDSPLEARQKASLTVEAMSNYLNTYLSNYHSESSFLGKLLTQHRAGRLDGDDLIANLILLFVAGHETTTNLLSNGLLTLLRNQEQMKQLRQDKTLLPNAVEEMLRFEGPAQMNARVTHEDIEVCGVPIKAGSLIYCMLGAANRDPKIFTNPNKFDISRQQLPHLTFGGGPHYCLGAPLARLECQIAFDQLLSRFSSITYKEDGVAWRDLINIRGLETLSITVY